MIAGYDYGKIIKISERYDSNSVPEFSLLEDKMGGAITIDVSAPNVAKFANLYDTKYMQLALTYPASLTLASVEFDNFVKGKKEICSHMVLDYGRQKVVVLYRGLLNGLDEQTTVSDLFARLVFETPEQNGTGQIGLTYDETGELMYGPLFRNHKNENIDGFVINYDPVQVVWGE